MRLVLATLVGAAINYFLIPDYIRHWLLVGGLALVGVFLIIWLCEVAARQS